MIDLYATVQSPNVAEGLRHGSRRRACPYRDIIVDVVEGRAVQSPEFLKINPKQQDPGESSIMTGPRGPIVFRCSKSGADPALPGGEDRTPSCRPTSPGATRVIQWLMIQVANFRPDDRPVTCTFKFVPPPAGRLFLIRCHGYGSESKTPSTKLLEQRLSKKFPISAGRRLLDRRTSRDPGPGCATHDMHGASWEESPPYRALARTDRRATGRAAHALAKVAAIKADQPRPPATDDEKDRFFGRGRLRQDQGIVDLRDKAIKDRIETGSVTPLRRTERPVPRAPLDHPLPLGLRQLQHRGELVGGPIHAPCWASSAAIFSPQRIARRLSVSCRAAARSQDFPQR